ncbi:hypothetical protein [Streptomyces sp. NPDC004682]
MTEQCRLMTLQEVHEFVKAALTDDNVDLSVPVTMSLALREGLRSAVVRGLTRGDYHPAVGDVPGSLTYDHDGQLQMVTLSPESELLLSAYLDR